MKDLTVFELKEKLEAGENVVLIDVREPFENEEFNIGGDLIPLGTLMENLPRLEAHKNAEIVIYCRSGRRSALAQGWLLEGGFQTVRNLTGGMLAWQEAFEK